jgi:putative flippase GtrA
MQVTNYITNAIHFIFRIWFSISEKIRYLLVGGWNTLFSICLFAILNFFLGKKIDVGIILGISHIISVLQSTFTFGIFVFRSYNNFLHKFIKTNVVYFLYFLINLLLLKILVYYFNKYVNVVVLQISVVVMLIVPTYIAHKLFSFR